MELKKVNDLVWEIPKTNGMHVPGLVYASEKLLSKIKEDKTLLQATNVAKLKGIVKAAYTMPDAHEGYGFPIGGVAAFDMEEGIVSPGGVGYDINCLTGENKVLTEFGYVKQICDLESDFINVDQGNEKYVLKQLQNNLNVASYDTNLRKFRANRSLFFIKRHFDGDTVKIQTKYGKTLRVTVEHPVLTEDGMVRASDIKKGTKVATNLFEGVEYEACLQIDIPIHGIPLSQINELSIRRLFPLTLDNGKIPILARLMGYLTGDGHIGISRGKGRIQAFGTLEDLQEIAIDFEALGFNARIYCRKRNHKITTKYGTKSFTAVNHELHVSSTSLSNLFFALGYPRGRKTENDFLVPEWILKSPKWIKRLYLSGLFGAELSSPRVHTKTGFDCPTLCITKNDSHKTEGRMFMAQIVHLLKEFQINTDTILIRDDYHNKQGKTIQIRLQISSKEENLERLWARIGFSYNRKRSILAQKALAYIKEKKLLCEKRLAIANLIKEYKKTGITLKEVQRLLASPYANHRFIERHYYKDCDPRISLDFVSFTEFEDAIGEMFFDTVDIVCNEKYCGFVYDLNVDQTHNFVANGIVVSNCGVRLLRTDLTFNEVNSKRRQLLDEIFKEVPAGVGKAGITKVSKDVMQEVVTKGAQWAIEQGYGRKEDLERTEEYGCMRHATAGSISSKAYDRGKPQLGTLGAGNHFLEIQKVDQIYDEKVATRFGITSKDQVLVMIHCGSRGLGHQVASDYIKLMEEKYGFEGLPDRELVNAPIGSELGKEYFAAMAGSINFAFANRQMIAHWVRDVFEKTFGNADGMHQIYDVCHNLAKIEEHIIDGEKRKVCVHRKGATRSFGPGREEIPEIYRDVGQPVIIPGSMGTSSYVLVGTKKAEEISFGSTAHGAGRVMSRNEALRRFRGETIAKELASHGVEVKATSWSGIAEESAAAYKDVDEVVSVSHKLGIGNLVARVVPIAVMKG